MSEITDRFNDFANQKIVAFDKEANHLISRFNDEADQIIRRYYRDTIIVCIGIAIVVPVIVIGIILFT